MKLKDAWRGLAIMLLIGIAAGVLNVLLFTFVMNPLTTGGKADEIAVNTYVVNFFVGWVFFSPRCLARADEELKKGEEAVHKADRETFLVEVPKRIAPSIRVLYLLISALVVLSFHLFHIESLLVSSEIQFGAGFLVVTTALVLWDLDDPLAGGHQGVWHARGMGTRTASEATALNEMHTMQGWILIPCISWFFKTCSGSEE
jgi:hypothetical protein